ncbi:MAG: hypothetical protein LUQ69_04430 [Methanoregulaceae archaeon]|nr:hypothetical protein [Methanoregulaceae archaeon]
MKSPEKKAGAQESPGPGEHGQKKPLLIEIIGLKDSACSPFPCDETRSCGLYECFPTGKLTRAADALKNELRELYGDKVELRLILIDKEIPGYVKEIIARECPPVPFVLINGTLVPLGRVSLTRMKKEVEKLV